jgi:hypothetical protein
MPLCTYNYRQRRKIPGKRKAADAVVLLSLAIQWKDERALSISMLDRRSHRPRVPGARKAFRHPYLVTSPPTFRKSQDVELHAFILASRHILDCSLIRYTTCCSFQTRIQPCTMNGQHLENAWKEDGSYIFGNLGWDPAAWKQDEQGKSEVRLLCTP